MYSKTVRQNNF